jgi:hypothetical protein
MKKLVFFLITIYCVLEAINVNAQCDGLKKVTGGVIFAASGTTDLSNIQRPFNYGQNLLLNVCFVEGKMYHNVVYSLPFNTIKVVNGIPFGEHGLDIYFVPGYNLGTKVASFSSGVEKKINNGGDVTFFLFSEMCKEIKSNSPLTFSVGFHVNIQTQLYNK